MYLVMLGLKLLILGFVAAADLLDLCDGFELLLDVLSLGFQFLLQIVSLCGKFPQILPQVLTLIL